MIHNLWNEDMEREETTGEKQRLWGNMVSNKSGCDIHAWGRERESVRCLLLPPAV